MFNIKLDLAGSLGFTNLWCHDCLNGHLFQDNLKAMIEEAKVAPDVLFKSRCGWLGLSRTEGFSITQKAAPGQDYVWKVKNRYKAGSVWSFNCKRLLNIDLNRRPCVALWCWVYSLEIITICPIVRNILCNTKIRHLKRWRWWWYVCVYRTLLASLLKGKKSSSKTTDLHILDLVNRWLHVTQSVFYSGAVNLLL